jgi:trehalose-6-phosphatase
LSSLVKDNNGGKWTVIKCMVFLIRNVLFFLQLKKVLQEITINVKGAMVEDNKFCISVHFRHVNEEVKDYSTVILRI